MKKSIAVILLGSALLLPNHQSAEAAQFTYEKAQTYKSIYTAKGEYKAGFPLRLVQDDSRFAYFEKVMKQCGIVIPSKPVEKPAEGEPVKPAEKPAPVEPSKPVEKPAPVEASKPVEKPAPVEPSKPVEKPAPVEPSTPVEKPTPVEPSTPVQPSVTSPDNNNQQASISATEQAVLDLTNAERQKAGLKPLQIDSKLMNSARQKSSDMARNNYFSHTSPTYGSPFDQMKQNGITYRAAAENIAMGQRTAQEVVKGWMESPGHRQNILTASFTHIGIGYDANGNYWTQQFIQK